MLKQSEELEAASSGLIASFGAKADFSEKPILKVVTANRCRAPVPVCLIGNWTKSARRPCPVPSAAIYGGFRPHAGGENRRKARILFAPDCALKKEPVYLALRTRRNRAGHGGIQ